MNKKRVEKRTRIKAERAYSATALIRSNLGITDQESIFEGIKRLTLNDPQPIKDFIDIKSDDIITITAQEIVKNNIVKLAEKVL
jgi:hypothetical protein